MKVTFKTGVAGNNFVYRKGVEYDLEAKQANKHTRRAHETGFIREASKHGMLMS